MEHIRQTLEHIHDYAITNEFDRIVLVIGDEGVGKSTFMVTATLHWMDIIGKPVDTKNVLDQIVWGERSEFKRAILENDARSAIPVMDAARVLHKKDAMKGDQVEIEKDLLDSRFKENLILLGFQDWDTIPRFLQKRRAKNAFVIPRRGYVRGYTREAIDKRYETGDWPDPALRDFFPSLDGLSIWERFKERDREQKEKRMLSEEDMEPEEIKKREQAKVVLRAVKPWDDNGGMTHRDAAKLIDYSRGWVGNVCRDWEDGKYRDLLPPLETHSQEGEAAA